jgi:hypothetical protein
VFICGHGTLRWVHVVLRRLGITEIAYTCRECGGLLDVVYGEAPGDPGS